MDLVSKENINQIVERIQEILLTGSNENAESDYTELCLLEQDLESSLRKLQRSRLRLIN